MPPFPRQDTLLILLIDDEPLIHKLLDPVLSKAGHQTHCCSSGEEGMAYLQTHHVDLVITDLSMPGMDGFAVLGAVKDTTPDTQVIILTGYSEVDMAVRAMREGAYDFLPKPVELAYLFSVLDRLIRYIKLLREKESYRQRLNRIEEDAQHPNALDAIIGRSTAVKEMKEMIHQICQSRDATVFISGETGTGKELVARAIHDNSERRDGPFVAINCTAMPHNLIESELFGHKKGAFTDAHEDRPGRFELAHGGTFFLDEIGDMDLALQSRLLRTLEERSVQRLGDSKEIAVDVRVVSATNRDIHPNLASGEFRSDLYYRLNTLTVDIPPLRERREDILPIARHFLVRYTLDMGKQVESFTPEAEDRLQHYSFPGNIRELRNIVERSIILCSTAEIGIEHLKFDDMPTSAAVREPVNESLNLAANEERLIAKALESTNHNQVKAARLLGISRDALRRRVDRYNL